MDVSTVSDPDDVDHEVIVEDLVDDPIHPDTHPIGVVLTGQFCASGRSGIVREQIDGGAYPLLFLTGQPGEGIDRASGYSTR
jgi:hypothetical protein